MSHDEVYLAAFYGTKPTVFCGRIDETTILDRVVGEVGESSDVEANKEMPIRSEYMSDMVIRDMLNGGFADS